MALYKGIEINMHPPREVMQAAADATKDGFGADSPRGLESRVKRFMKGEEIEPWSVARVLDLVDGVPAWGKALGSEAKTWLKGLLRELAGVDEATAGVRGKDASLGLGTVKSVKGELKAASDAEDDLGFTAVVSTEAVDRHGDVVVVAGLDLAAYRKNPVILYNHNYYFPIARCEDIRIEGNKLIAKGKFPPAGEDEDADKVRKKLKAGLLGAVSIGFLPDYDSIKAIDPDKPWNGYRYEKAEMLEFSIVTVPANSEALITERQLGGAGKPSKLTKAMDAELEGEDGPQKEQQGDVPKVDETPPTQPVPQEGDNLPGDGAADPPGEAEVVPGEADPSKNLSGEDTQQACADDLDQAKSAETAKRLRQVQLRRLRMVGA